VETKFGKQSFLNNEPIKVSIYEHGKEIFFAHIPQSMFFEILERESKSLGNVSRITPAHDLQSASASS